jgi:hypothetical protein
MNTDKLNAACAATTDFGLRREAKRHAAFGRNRSHGKRCRRYALPPQSKSFVIRARSCRIHPWLFYALKMQPDIQEAKALLRKQIRGALQKISPAARFTLSAQIATGSRNRPFGRMPDRLFFAPLPDEADVWPLLEDALAGKKLPPCPALIPRAMVMSPAGCKTCGAKL